MIISNQEVTVQKLPIPIAVIRAGCLFPMRETRLLDNVRPLGLCQDVSVQAKLFVKMPRLLIRLARFEAN